MEKKYLSRDIIGKQVIDTRAIIVGKVKDFSLDMVSKNVTLVVTTAVGEDKTIDGSDVATVGDVVLLTKQVVVAAPAPSSAAPQAPKPQPTPQPTSASGLCGNCGYQNDTSAKFCIKCGTRLPASR